MNKARSTMSGSLIKHRAYLKYIKYNKNVNNNNNNNSSSSSSSTTTTTTTTTTTNNNNKEEEEEINENFEMED
jgi:uncharacterized protein YfaP (DUF2135 family)